VIAAPVPNFSQVYQLALWISPDGIEALWFKNTWRDEPFSNVFGRLLRALADPKESLARSPNLARLTPPVEDPERSLSWQAETLTRITKPFSIYWNGKCLQTGGAVLE
jgi:hypothetical protein